MKDKSIISLLVGLALFAIGIYTVIFVTKTVDFKTTTVIINDNKELWKFMAFIPIMILMFTGAMLVLNGLLNLKSINIISIILCIALLTTIFTKSFFRSIPWNDQYGFVSIIPDYHDLMDKVSYALFIAIGLIVVDVVLNILAHKKANKFREA